MAENYEEQGPEDLRQILEDRDEEIARLRDQVDGRDLLSPEEVAAHEQAQKATSGAVVADGGRVINPNAPREAFDEVVARDGTRDEAMAAFFRTKIDQEAAQGFPSAKKLPD